MERSHLLGVIVIIILLGSMSIAGVVPALAHNNGNNGSNVSCVSSTQRSYGYNGYVLLQLPSPSTPNHPYNLRLTATHFDERSMNGREDYLSVYVWCPAFPGGSRFVWMGLITDSQAGADFMVEIYTGYAGAVNQIVVEDGVIEVTKKGDVLTVNLTKSIAFNIGDPWPQYLKDLNFTLPPMTMQFRGIDEMYMEEEAPVKITAPASGAGWTTQNTFWSIPSWVQVKIPMWYGNNAIHTQGILNAKVISAWTPPPAP